MKVLIGIFVVSVVIQRVIARKHRSSPASWGLLGIMITHLLRRNEGYNAETGVFRLNGFRMDTRTGQFTINGFEYHKSTVREVQWQPYHNVLGREVGGKITIVVNDLYHPVHNLIFRTVFADFDANVEQMKMLLCA